MNELIFAGLFNWQPIDLEKKGFHWPFLFRSIGFRNIPRVNRPAHENNRKRRDSPSWETVIIKNGQWSCWRRQKKMFQRVVANPKTPLNNPRRPSIVNYYYWCYREEGPMSSSSYQIHVHKIYTPQRTQCICLLYWPGQGEWWNAEPQVPSNKRGHD